MMDGLYIKQKYEYYEYIHIYILFTFLYVNKKHRAQYRTYTSPFYNLMNDFNHIFGSFHSILLTSCEKLGFL
jgi:hypothetical protein